MIHVKRTTDESSQKIIGSFLKRVKKFNLIARKRKTQNYSKPISTLRKKQKAIRQAIYKQKQEIIARIAK